MGAEWDIVLLDQDSPLKITASSLKYHVYLVLYVEVIFYWFSLSLAALWAPELLLFTFLSLCNFAGY